MDITGRPFSTKTRSPINTAYSIECVIKIMLVGCVSQMGNSSN